ncbi:MAG: hypothetical protein WD872_09710 [Pirellulaceae bacterium]
MNLKSAVCGVLILSLAPLAGSQQPAEQAGSAGALARAAQGEATPQILDEMPSEIVHEGTRLFDFKFSAEPGTVLASGEPLDLTFGYETNRPGKVLVGGLPVNLKGAYVGGHQPAMLDAAKGTATLRVYCGAEPVSKPIATLTELKESYQPLAKLEIQIYGQVKSPAKVRVPINFLVIPAANFTVYDKFYLDSLVSEVRVLRRRIRELEAKHSEGANSVSDHPKP